MSIGVSQIRCLRVYPLCIRLRKPFRHAAHVRADADPMVFQVELANGVVGYGETLPRSYVTGEDVESVLRTVRQTFLNELMAFRPESFPEALERIEALPTHNPEGHIITAARAGVELALLDAYSRYFERPVSDAVGWFGLPAQGPPGSSRKVRYSGVLSSDDPRRLRSSARKMRWYGLRDFKLKVGFEQDVERIRNVAGILGRSLGATTTLRLDANGGWSLQRAIEVLQAVEDIPIACVEQPFARGAETEAVALKQAIAVTLMHDESLLVLTDAQRLQAMRIGDGLNVRLSKNGGFFPSLRLAHFARRHGLMLQLGCMVGETSILSAAGRRFIENVPGLSFIEGSYGRHLLLHDVVKRPVMFGYRGRAKTLPGLGWGIHVDPAQLQRYTQPGMVEFPL